MSASFSNFDAFLMHIEKPTNLMVVTGLLFFDLPMDIFVLKSIIQERFLRIERFQQRVVNTGFILKSPRWEFDPTFDLNAHVHKLGLPAPGDEIALKDVVNDLMTVPVDLTKPPWQIYLVENFGEGSVIIARLHHTLADGISLVHVFTSMSDEVANPPPPATTLHHRRRPASLIGRLIIPPLKLTSKVLDLTQWTLHQGLEMLDNPGYIKDAVKDAAGDAKTLSGYVLGKPDPQTSLRGKTGIAKIGTWSAPIPLEQVKSLGKALGGTVNDVMLAAVAGGLRRYLEANGETIDYLDIRAIVPVNVRKSGEFESLGNQVGMVLMPLPIGEDTTAERYQVVKMRMDDLKDSGSPGLIFNLLNAPLFKSKPLVTAMVGMLTSKASLVVTNVPGPMDQIWLAGRKIRHAVFWVPQPAGWGLGISILSYAGEVTLGVAVDASLIPNPDLIVKAIEAELQAMHEWAGKNPQG